MQHSVFSSDILNFWCAVCGRGYKNKCTLNRHLRFECNKEPQFECNICDYKAKQKSTLKAHMIKHSREQERAGGHRISSQKTC
ncbi:hypothetical protein LSTR_LSTR001010 [Laodelphax striatellus]|uniref:C2H2-type domain-containing protein n=1 Tax=Laodelphax striatellus TaxID=195883 RepID=A0A482X0Y5_LAOST|nr:hypothetical protein LSTR_LSTR001010 [Laodelphax striatellus]